MARQKNDGRGRLGGRQKGSTNKTTREMREVLAPILTAYMGDGLEDGDGGKMSLVQDLKDMAPDERGRIMKDLMAYVAPKMASMEVKAEVERKTYQDELDEMSAES